MLSINGKKFMNLSEAVQWLLDNNALPFQCTANYVADTVIAKSTIINPSPLEIKVGSLVLFADSKVGTVSGVTDTGFMVGQQYTDIGAQLNQIINIELDASAHLIFTLGNGDTIDAGLVKELSSLTIDASQHLIANYNDGTSTDLGPIFQGDVSISGTLTATHAKILENIEDSAGNKRFIEGDIVQDTPITGFTLTYSKWSLSGTHLMFVVAGTIANNTTLGWQEVFAETTTIPKWVIDKIYPTFSNYIEPKVIRAYNGDGSTYQDITFYLRKGTSSMYMSLSNVAITDDRYLRVQFDLLIDNA